jgi:hypothetical protein
VREPLSRIAAKFRGISVILALSRLAKTPMLERSVDMAALGMALEKASGRRRIWQDQG